MEQITIDLPHPPAALKPNSRPHWRADAKDLCDECADTKRDEEGT